MGCGKELLHRCGYSRRRPKTRFSQDVWMIFCMPSSTHRVELQIKVNLFAELLGSPRTVKILFLSFICEDIGVVMIANTIRQ